ncbi:MAG TPA: DUF4255 domain-containing protein [Cyanobacteria bacterium UBA8803]|nr:DUF4255 domain-containing protein [Cyanobacteria bacterium UBA9273]HBL58264.1 DUF4255 domain-containing protein [Cyanobacteria bacterium UBA8803]
MLQDLDKTIEELLKCELLPDLATQVTISFAPPNKEFLKSLPAISLFLYDVRENLDLRSNEWSLERSSNGTAMKKRPPARVDCSYLITAWSNDAADFQTEHKLLGEVMKVLLRYRQLPEAVLQGSLAQQEPPIRTAILRPNLLQSLGEFWQAIGGTPKAALNYTVTIAVSVDEAAESVPLVVSKTI